MSERWVFGQCSLFDVEISSASDLPQFFPVERYLTEALLGMCGAPKDAKADAKQSGSQSEGSATWRQLYRAFAAQSARGCCAALVWLTIGVLFGTVAEDASAVFREKLASQWFLFAGQRGLQGKERDRILDFAPTVFVQAIYRLLIDAFPPEREKLTQHADQLLEKLGNIVQYEVSGFRPDPGTLRELRKKAFRKQVLSNPHMNVVEARRAELRQQKLEGQTNRREPLEFGDLEPGRALDETQLEHVMEGRLEAMCGGHVGAGGVGRASTFVHASMPPLCPPDLDVSRYDAVALNSEEMFDRHMALNDPGEDEEERPSPHDMAMSATWASTPATARLSCIGGAKPPRNIAAEQSERRRRDELLADRLTTPLPSLGAAGALSTSRVSPMLDRMAPGAQAPQREEHTLRMVEPKAQLLPFPGVPTRRGSPGSREAALAATTGSLAKGSKMNSTGSLGDSRGFDGFGKLLPRLSGTHGQGGAGAEGDGTTGEAKPLAEPPLRVRQQVVLKRLEQDIESFHKRSFEHYKKDYDIMTGTKKSRLDKERLAKEEDIYVKRLESLGCSRSAPALQPLGVGPFGSEGRHGRGGSRGGGSRGAAKLQVSGPLRVSVRGSGALGAGPATAAAKLRPWNELTGLETPGASARQ